MLQKLRRHAARFLPACINDYAMAGYRRADPQKPLLYLLPKRACTFWHREASDAYGGDALVRFMKDILP